MTQLSVEQEFEHIQRGAVEIINERELKQKLEAAQKNKKPLIVKAGFDPTAPDIHLGHSVLIRKMRHFQDLGHTVVFLIGDYTGMIGDPTGKSKTRPPLTTEEVLANAETYKTQVGKILDINKISITFNSEWFKKLTLKDILLLTGRLTVARCLERDDFTKRLKRGDDISMVELLYPLMQAYDSVALQADIELGGQDQRFNLLMGRTIQKRYNQKPQVCLMMPLLVGLDGVDKMSKSLGNYIGINESANEMFGKIMRLSDELMWNYFELLTDIPQKIIVGYKQEIQSGRNPKEIKVILGKDIVQQYHTSKAADDAQAHFEKIFVKKEIPDTIPAGDLIKEAGLVAGECNLVAMIAGMVRALGGTISKKEAQRLIQGGGVQIDKEKYQEIGFIPDMDFWKKEHIFKAGKKRFYRHIGLS